MTARLRLLVFVLLLLCGVGRTARAGSPWWVDINGSGVPYTWPGGEIIYIMDTGGLGPCTQDDVVNLVKESFSTWSNAGLFLSGTLGSGKPVPTVSLIPTYGGMAKKKITASNLAAYLKHGAVIVFDADGSLLKAMGYPTVGVRAITVEQKRDPATLRLLNGTTILNGLHLKDAQDCNSANEGIGEFTAALVHEIGHLLNLDHSGLNAAQAAEIFADPNRANEVPTMYPIVEFPDQKNLHWDDVVAISNLYPRAELTSQFCTIAGTIIGSDGKGFQGAQVITRMVQDQMTVAVSAITGNAFPQDAADGSYILRGILPGKPYAVTFEELTETFDEIYSSIQPYGDEPGETPRRGFGDGLITAGNGKAKVVQCLNPGETILMDTVQLAISSGAKWQPTVALVPSENQPVVTVDGGKPKDPTTTPSTNNPSGSESATGCSLLKP